MCVSHDEMSFSLIRTMPIIPFKFVTAENFHLLPVCMHCVDVDGYTAEYNQIQKYVM